LCAKIARGSVLPKEHSTLRLVHTVTIAAAYGEMSSPCRNVRASNSWLRRPAFTIQCTPYVLTWQMRRRSINFLLWRDTSDSRETSALTVESAGNVNIPRTLFRYASATNFIYGNRDAMRSSETYSGDATTHTGVRPQQCPNISVFIIRRRYGTKRHRYANLNYCQSWWSRHKQRGQHKAPSDRHIHFQGSVPSLNRARCHQTLSTDGEWAIRFSHTQADHDNRGVF